MEATTVIKLVIENTVSIKKQDELIKYIEMLQYPTCIKLLQVKRLVFYVLHIFMKAKSRGSGGYNQ